MTYRRPDDELAIKFGTLARAIIRTVVPLPPPSFLSVSSRLLFPCILNLAETVSLHCRQHGTWIEGILKINLLRNTPGYWNVHSAHVPNSLKGQTVSGECEVCKTRDAVRSIHVNF